jgi:hypothetical protein
VNKREERKEEKDKGEKKAEANVQSALFFGESQQGDITRGGDKGRQLVQFELLGRNDRAEILQRLLVHSGRDLGLNRERKGKEG